MTRDRDFKSVVRNRMAKTGESYASARAQLRPSEAVEDDQGLGRIVGLETRYIPRAVLLGGQRRLEPPEVARYMFRKVVQWGRSSNVYLPNGSRLYLSSHDVMEYATPECASLEDLLAHSRAGERILQDLAKDAEGRLAAEGVDGNVTLRRGEPTMACDENYLVSSTVDAGQLMTGLTPFLVSRQIMVGAGGVVTNGHSLFCISPRAENIPHDGAMVRSAPTYADAQRWIRLEVRIGEPNVGDYATFLKVGTAHLVLRALEHDSTLGTSLTLQSPVRALREISRDPGCSRTVPLEDGRAMTAIDIQRQYLILAKAVVETQGGTDQERRVLNMWARTLDQLEQDPTKLVKDLDWVAKWQLLQESGKALSGFEALEVDGSFSDLGSDSSAQLNTLVSERAVEDAKRMPPPTRARLRGEFIEAARKPPRTYTVDWVHLKLNDRSPGTIVLSDPFESKNERVAKMIASMRSASSD